MVLQLGLEQEELEVQELDSEQQVRFVDSAEPFLLAVVFRLVHFEQSSIRRCDSHDLQQGGRPMGS
jgi:hypothetical protein